LRRWLVAFPVPSSEVLDYHTNKDVVLAEALSTLCRLAIRPDTKAICAAARHLVDQDLVGRAVHYTVGPAGRPVTILVDPPHAPPAYQQLVLGYLAHIVSHRARRDRTAERALLAAARGTLALVGPDGDAAYWGRSQEQSWAVILGAYGLRIAARLARDDAEADRILAAADAMVERFARLYRGGPYALWIVPAFREDPFSRPPALDDYANVATYAGLTAVALTWLASAPAPAPRPRVRGPGRGVAVLFPIGEDAFATVRRGDIWFAVRKHGARAHGDLRSDFGLLAAQCRGATGWRALVAVRPRTTAGIDSAGPVLRTRGGRVGYPDGTALAIDRDGALIVTGGWRDAAGRWVRRARFRFAAVTGGVRLGFPVHKGDEIRYSVFAEQPVAGRRAIVDERARTGLSAGAGPPAHEFLGGFVSSDSSRLTRGTLVTVAPRTARIAITTEALTRCGQPL
jgi:hypothetical protein